MVWYIITRGSFYCVLIFLKFVVKSSLTIVPTRRNNKAGIINGDIFLGGLFRIHQNTGTTNCANDTIEVQLGIQRMEAMVYAIQKVNKNKRLLPNVTLGAEIRDTCSVSTVALDESLKFILDSLSLRANSDAAGNCVGNISKDVVGVVGASRSTFSIEVAKLLRLFSVPQVSYASTSAELSNNEKYSYFARTVPPDTHQASAMLDIIRNFKWKSVFTINSEGSYGEQGIGEFKKLIGDDSPCVVFSAQVNDKDGAKHYDDIIDDFIRISSTTRVVVLFVHDNHAKLLLQSARKKKYEDVVWIASDDWGIRQRIVENLGTFWDKSQAITISLPSPPLLDFKNYFNNLSVTEKRDANPWFEKYWKQQNCSKTCIVSSFNDKLAYVIDAVYAFAHALHDMYKDKCPMMTGLCAAMKPVNGTDLRDRLLKVRFKGESSDNFEFDDYGDSKGRYNLSLYGKNRQYVSFGEWQSKLKISDAYVSSLRKVISMCDDECFPWSRRMKRDDAKCCIKCSNCSQRTRQYVSRADNVTCITCKDHEKPNSTYDGCTPLPLRYVPNEWVIVVSVFAGFGVLVTLIFLTLFLLNFNTPLVRASGRDLMSPLFLGVLLNYIMTFFLVSKPTEAICAIQRFGFGFSSSICYASILLKTNRIARIFSARKVQSISFTKPHTQMLILVLLVAVEVSLVSVGLIMDPPRVIKILPTEHDVLAKCNVSKNDYAISLPYNLFLVILCTIYAFRTRKMPSSFNEAKYLGFVMYTTCIIWIAFLPVFYGTAEHYQPIALSLNTTLNATTILVFLFGPKIYVMVFSPDRNVPSSITTISRSALDLGTAGNIEHAVFPPIPNDSNNDTSNKQTSQGHTQNQESSADECKFNSEESSQKASHIYTDGDDGNVTTQE